MYKGNNCGLSFYDTYGGSLCWWDNLGNSSIWSYAIWRSVSNSSFVVWQCGEYVFSLLATENLQAIINDVIDVKMGVYLRKTQTNTVKNNKEHAEWEWEPRSGSQEEERSVRFRCRADKRTNVSSTYFQEELRVLLHFSKCSKALWKRRSGFRTALWREQETQTKEEKIGKLQACTILNCKFPIL